MMQQDNLIIKVRHIGMVCDVFHWHENRVFMTWKRQGKATLLSNVSIYGNFCGVNIHPRMQVTSLVSICCCVRGYKNKTTVFCCNYCKQIRLFSLYFTDMSAKRIKNKDLKRVYRQAYKQTFNWQQILPDDIYTFMDHFDKAKGCPLTLMMGALVPLTASVCGPDTRICDSVLNNYIFNVCNPGGGKTNTYLHVIRPIIDALKDTKKIALATETYTSAGLHTHQAKNKVYFMLFI